MHTFFVNTSDRIDVSHHEILFDNLRANNGMFNLHYSIDNLSDCVEEISKLITRNRDITEEYNIIVYVEVEEKNEAAFAKERVLYLRICEELFAGLYKRGRKAKQALILFGENFDRNAGYRPGKTFTTTVREKLWEVFPVPDISEAMQVLDALRVRFPNVTESELYEYQDAFCTEMLKNAHGGSIIPKENENVRKVLFQMADSLKGREQGETVDLVEELYLAVGNLDSSEKYKTDEKPMIAYVRLCDSDFNAWNRTVYRILLFVYYCATEQAIELVNDKSAFNDASSNMSDDRVNNTNLNNCEPERCSCTIPHIDWDGLAAVLSERGRTLENKYSGLNLYESEFECFDSSLTNEGTKIVSIDVEKPKLVTKMRAHGGLTVSQLKKAVADTVEDIRTKNESNCDLVNKYIEKAVSIFSKSKATAMGGADYMDSENMIKSVPLTKEYIKREQDKANGTIAARSKRSFEATHISSIIAEAEIRISYCFDCLKAGALLYVFGVIFTLLFAIPYGVIQWEIFTSVHGWVSFAAVLAAVIGAYTIGYRIFRVIYKRRIMDELADLCEKFRKTQEENVRLLDEFYVLLTHDIPLSYCLRTYEMKFDEYVKSFEENMRYITYHKKTLNKYMKYLSNLFDDLALRRDVNALAVEPDDHNLVVGRDEYENDCLYSIVDASTIDRCIASADNGEDE